jgi:4,5-dihydroxyphthalate decarboxylase
MADVRLTLAMVDYDRTAPLRDGTVKPAGIDLTYLVSPPSETFWRMLKFDEFDVAEMSLSSFLIARAQGRAWTAIPVFPFRALFHTYVFVRADSPISGPADLAGRRFGVPEYQMTAAVWVRGALEHDFGVPPPALRWYVERSRSLSHGGQTGFTAPSGVSIEQISGGRPLAAMLEAGELDAIMPSPYGGMTSMLNKTDLFQLLRSRRVKPLFADSLAESARYVGKHGFSQINHTVVIQDRVLQRDPWVALTLFRAFEAAKEQCYGKLDYLLRSSLMPAFGMLEQQRRLFGDDPFPYGLAANRAPLERLADHSFEQGLSPARANVDELFAPTTRD